MSTNPTLVIDIDEGSLNEDWIKVSPEYSFGNDSFEDGSKIPWNLVISTDTKGGPGSGNFGHSGRPGKVGGSNSGTTWVTKAVSSYENGTATLLSDETLSANVYAFENSVIKEPKPGFSFRWTDFGGAMEITSQKFDFIPEIKYVMSQKGPVLVQRKIDIDTSRSVPSDVIDKLVSTVKDAGYIPRDMRPGNVVYDTDGKVWILDIGEWDYPLDVVRQGWNVTGVTLKSSDGQNVVTHGLVNKSQPWVVLTDNKGGPGSGNFGHAGRPGQIGGSAPVSSRPTGRDGDGGIFDIQSWQSLSVPERLEKWGKLSNNEQDRLASAHTSVKRNQAAIISHAGDHPEFQGDVKSAISDRMSSLTTKNGEDFIPTSNSQVIHQTVNELDDVLEQAGVKPEHRYALAMEAADTLVAQDHESLGRIIGDHGIRHIRGNLETALQIQEAHPGEDTAQDIATTYLAQVFHDTGYLTDPSRNFLDRGHDRWSDHHYNENVGGLVKQALGARAMGDVSHIIRTHAATNIDWKDDVVASANRVSDNLALFQKEKLPSALYLVPANVGIMERLGAKSISLSSAKSQMISNIRRSRFSGAIKAQLISAVNEVMPISPKFFLGMLGGSLGKINWKGNHLQVTLRRNAEATRLQRILDLGQKQFAKFAKTYGLDPDHFLNTLEFEFRDNEGNVLLSSVIEEEKMLRKLLKVLYEAEEDTKGGPGSGNFGHSGRPGQIGGSNPKVGGSGFSPASSRQEAEEYAARFVRSQGEVSYRGINLEVANEINQSLTDIYSTSEDVPSFYGIKGQNFSRSRRLDDEAPMAVDGSGMLLINSAICGSKEKFASWKSEGEKARQYVESSLKQGNLSEELTDRAKRLLSFKRQLIDTSLTGLVQHEFAHRFDWERLITKKSRGGPSVRERVLENMPNWVDKISARSATNAFEYIAESFVAYKNGIDIDPVLANVFEEHGL